MNSCSFPTVKLKNIITSPPKPLETGPSKVQLITRLLNGIRDQRGYMTLNRLENSFKDLKDFLILPHPLSEEYCMLVYLAKNKEMTLQDKLTYFKRDTLTGKLFLILDLELITKDQDSPDWWTGSVERKSRRLWLPTKTDCSDLDLNCSNKSAKKITLESGFMETKILQIPIPKQNSKKISSLSSTCSLPKTTDCDPVNSKKLENSKKQKKKKLKMNKKQPIKFQIKTPKVKTSKVKTPKVKTPKENPNSVRKIRLYPNHEQQQKLLHFFGCNRSAYNLIVEKTKDKIFDFKIPVNDLKAEVRPFVQKKKIAKNSEYEYLKSVPEEILDSAFRDVFKARETTIEASKAQKQKTGKGFVCEGLKFKSKKDHSNSIEIRTRTVKNNGNNTITFWKSFFGKNNRIPIKDILPELNFSVRLQRLRTGRYYLCIPGHGSPITKEPEKTKRVCAIDPGVRTFLTGYDPQGIIFKIGTNIKEIVKRWKLVDKLTSILRTFQGKRNKRYNIQRTKLQILGKIERMIKDGHHKAAKWLSEKYDIVLLPNFETSEMVKKNKRVIGAETVRCMSGWSHYKFKQLLKQKMEKTGGSVIACTEEYTSKTCTGCGRINHLLGGSKKFVCRYKDCGLEIDRDIGAGRDIYLKNHKLIDIAS